MFGALNFNDEFAVLDGIHASYCAAGSAKLTPAIDLTKFRKVVFIIDSGTLSSTGTLDFQVQGSTTLSGSYTELTNGAITQLTYASNNANYVIYEVDTAQVEDLGMGYTALKGSLLAGTENSTSAVIVLGFQRHYGNGVDLNAATVAGVYSYVG